MLFIVGSLVVTISVFGGFVLHGGQMGVLYQPTEYLMIGGSAIGAFIISNPKAVINAVLSSMKGVMKGPSHKKEHFLELLCLLYQVCKLIKAKGALAVESHVENPHESQLFAEFPHFLHDHHAVPFLCDYLRLWTLGTDNPHEMEALIDEELETHHHEVESISGAIQAVADALPALGIVAAVLGVINTMGSISEPPEVLGKLIAAALVGTFLGVFLAYGFIGPMASSLKASFEAEGKYFQCIKAALLAHMNGSAPAVTVEFARKTLPSDVRPTFYEVETAVSELPAPA